MEQEEKITLQTDTGEAVDFYVLEETRINGMNYLLVTDSEEDEADCWILKDLSGDGEEEAVYEMVEDDSELMAVSKVFQEMLDNVDITM